MLISKTQTNFSCFRNPYERLFSAYIDKALQRKGLYVKQFNNPCHWLNTRKHFLRFKLAFEQFVDGLWSKAKMGFQKHSSNTEYLDLSSRSAGIYLDHHQAPQVQLSKPCTTSYTLIGSHEHFFDGTSAIIKILKFNLTVKANSSLKSYKIIMISDLKELYRLDFKIFGYNSTPPL